MTMGEFVGRYGREESAWAAGGEKVERVRMEAGLGEADVVVGVHKVYLTQPAFHYFEDQLRSCDVEETKCARALDADLADGGHANTYYGPLRIIHLLPRPPPTASYSASFTL
ncbi:hypothetical protein C8F04DRAFT_1405783 [Mycena alexandri]|uniref:Uncharacterized protein n=1 Tax=Mycena alexandri TaxID=1745969 RepID=A0AAD6RYW0_9AGAR|nr:hypothetical protein C8F04DRAFT_1405783 [Mycena alexandri]